VMAAQKSVVSRLCERPVALVMIEVEQRKGSPDVAPRLSYRRVGLGGEIEREFRPVGKVIRTAPWFSFAKSVVLRIFTEIVCGLRGRSGWKRSERNRRVSFMEPPWGFLTPVRVGVGQVLIKCSRDRPNIRSSRQGSPDALRAEDTACHASNNLTT